MLRSPLRTRPNARRHIAVVLAALVAPLADGCTRDIQPRAAESTAITRTAEEAGSTLTLTLSDDDFPFADGAVLTVRATAPVGTRVTLTDYEALLHQSELAFEVRVAGVTRRLPEEASSEPLVWTDRYELEFVLPGEYELPGATASFSPDSAVHGDGVTANNEGKAQADAMAVELTTEAVSLQARAAQNAPLSDEELAAIKVMDPYELPPKWSHWWWLAGAGVVLGAVAFLLRRRIAAYFRRRTAERAVRFIVVPPDVWARRQLAGLVAEGMLERGLFQAFHYRVSYIVRGYIERRFDVSAGEMTTEEFLDATLTDRRFGPDVRSKLKPFLIACDLVKYAKHTPTGEESMASLHAAEVFVQRTKPATDASADGPARGHQDRGHAA